MDLTDLKQHWLNNDKIEFHTEDQLYVNEKLISLIKTKSNLIITT